MAPREFGGISDLDRMMTRSGSVDAAPDAVSRSRRRRRGGAAAAIVFVVIGALIGGYCYASLTAPLSPPVSAVHKPAVTVPPAAVLATPIDAQAAISVAGGDAYLGTPPGGILVSNGGDDPAPIASISKLVTAMVILDAKPLAASAPGPTITFDKTAHDLYDKYYVQGATIAAMPTGSTMSEHDALETMLVISASNYAEAVSTWAFGSQPAFLGAARRWLAKHGLAHTRIYEPTGLDDRNTSSPSDLLALGRLAMADPVISAIVGKTSLDVPALQGQPNTNDLLGTDGVDGIKTGTLEGHGSDLLFSATVPIAGGPQLTVTGVLLSGASRGAVDDDVRAFIASLEAGFHSVPVATAGQVVGDYTTPWGAKAKMVLSSAPSLFTYSNTPITSTMVLSPLKSGRDGEKLGAITWKAGAGAAAATASADIVLQGSIRQPTQWWRLTHPREVLGWPIGD